MRKEDAIKAIHMGKLMKKKNWKQDFIYHHNMHTDTIFRLFAGLKKEN